MEERSKKRQDKQARGLDEKQQLPMIWIETKEFFWHQLDSGPLTLS